MHGGDTGVLDAEGRYIIEITHFTQLRIHIYQTQAYMRKLKAKSIATKIKVFFGVF
jgi:hypothetical protein